MSDSDAGGEKEQESKRTSRPVTAAARRERRASARPAGKASAKEPDKARPATKAASSTEGATKAAETKKGRATPKRDRKQKKPSIFARLVRFIREVWAELRKVIWPTRKQMITYTTVVLVFVAFMVALTYVLDFAFRKGVFWLFG